MTGGPAKSNTFIEAVDSPDLVSAVSGKAQATRWNTDLIEKSPASTVKRPEDFFVAEKPYRSAAEQYHAFVAQEARKGGLYPHDSALYKSLDRIFAGVIDTGAALAGRPLTREEFSFDIIRTPTPNAYIYHGEGFKPHIFITTGFLEALEKRYGEVRQGHLAMVLGHELKHFLEGHYRTEQGEGSYRVEGDPLPYRDFGSLAAKRATEDFFLGRAFTRDQEFQCDEFGLNITTRLGYPSREAIELLELLVAMKEEAESSARPRSRLERDTAPGQWLVRSIVATHPASESRVFRARGIARNIEIQAFGENTEINGAAPPSHSISLPAPLLSLEQRTLIELERTLDEKSRPLAFDSVKKSVHEIEASAEPVTEKIRALRTLYLLAPAYLAVRESVVPRQPWCTIRDEPLDDLDKLKINSFEQQIAPLRAHIGKALQDAIEQSPPSLDRELQQLIGLDLMYRGPDKRADETRNFISNTLVVTGSAHEVGDILEAIARVGTVPVNLHAGFARFLDRLLESPPAANAHIGEFICLFSQGGRELRAEILAPLLEDGLLELLESTEELVTAVERIERLFADSPTALTRITPVLGEAVSAWAHYRDLHQSSTDFDHFLSSLQNRSSLPHGSVDSLSAELITARARHLSPHDFAAQVQWVTTIAHAGKTRDIILVRLLEGETEWFNHSTAASGNSDPAPIWSASQNHELVGTPFSIDGEPSKQFVRCFETISPYLDLRWSNPTILLGDIERPNSLDDLGSNLEDDWLFSSVALRSEELGYSSALCRFANTSGFTLQCASDPAANEVRLYLRTMIHLFLGEHRGDSESPTIAAGREVLFSLFERNPDARPFLLEGHQVSETSLTEAERARLADIIGPSTPYARFWEVDPAFGGELISPTTLEGLRNRLESIPPGPARDFLVLYSLGFASQMNALSERLSFLEELADCRTNRAKCEALFERYGEEYAGYGRRLLLRKQSELEDSEAEIDDRIQEEISFFDAARDNCDLDRRNLVGRELDSFEQPWNATPLKNDPLFFRNAIATLDLLSFGNSPDRSAHLALPLDRVQRLEAAKKVFSDYSLYLALRCGERLPNGRLKNVELTFPEFDSVAAEVGRVLYERFDRGRPAPRTSSEIEHRLDEITTFLRNPSEQRDRFLLDILDRSTPSAAGANTAIYSEPWVRRIYDCLTSNHVKHDLGRKIYTETLRNDPTLVSRFEEHLTILLDLHPVGSVSREDALKHFIDEAGSGGVVRTWADRDSLEARLTAEREAHKRDSSTILRNGALMLVLDAAIDVGIPAKERVDTVLWAIGLRGKSHLVECIELLEGQALPDLKNHGDKLTESEKRELVRIVLAGPQGLLSTDDRAAKREFLDTLFFTVFKGSRETAPESQRAFKAVYDCMLHHLDPHRAAEFLGNFLVSHLDGKDFNHQVKIFFESFDFIGIKTAQYLVSATTLIPDDMRRTLLDLTSRVKGPPKLDVFDQAELVYGAAARSIIHSIGGRVGGGSLMSFYEVTLWNDSGTGPGKRGVIGMLRPDVVAKMPEDLRLVSRLTQTMQEAPELFGGEHISSDLMDNLARQSLIETNLERTIRLQRKMRTDLLGESNLAVPEVWDSESGVEIDGETGLSRGPFVFMDFARGETLDLYLSRFETTDTDGRPTLTPEGMLKAREISTRIAKVFFEQITTHGLVHCDLHPGNILIHESDGTLQITILDVGLSTELSPPMREAAGKLLKIMLNNAHQGSQVEELIKSWWYGTGKVSSASGKAWIGDIVNVFESLAGERWAAETKSRVVNVIWDVLNDPTRPAQARLAAITGVSRDLGITLPPEIFYLVRAASITNHLWQHTDWRALQPVLSKLGKDLADAHLPALQVEQALKCIQAIDARVPLPGFHQTTTRGYLELAARKSDLIERVKILRDLCTHLAKDDPTIARTVLSAIAEDRTLQRSLGLDRVGQTLREILKAIPKGTEPPLHDRTVFVSTPPLPDGQAAEIGFLERFGSKVRVWDGILHTGTLLRVNGGHHRNSVLVVESPSPTEIHDNDGCLLRPLRRGIELEHSSRQVSEAIRRKTRNGNSWATAHDEGVSALRIAEAFNVIFEDGGFFEEIQRAAIRAVDQYLTTRDVEADERLDKVMEGIRKKNDPIFFEMGEYLRRAIEITARPQQIVSLGALLEDPEIKVEIFVRGRWQPIATRLIQEGETRLSYYAALERERERLRNRKINHV